MTKTYISFEISHPNIFYHVLIMIDNKLHSGRYFNFNVTNSLLRQKKKNNK